MVYTVQRAPRARFDEKYEVDPTGCWVWKSAHNGRYPKFWDLAYGGQCFAHRWSYEHFVAPIPDGMEIDHLCRRTMCVNPDHLEAVEHGENMKRLAATRTHCPSGHPYAGENIQWYRGARRCRQCDRDAKRAKTRSAREATEAVDHIIWEHGFEGLADSSAQVLDTHSEQPSDSDYGDCPF